ncbi:hypothetical protein [Brevundimonas aveniformis]|uniref:hypothetical protein n=1 Tax=Brevundimonas aveniformis TaxID=370977 RepID=UPI00248FA4E9|nr:hypothetical protein [Brevundimonas aveniformis]
MNVELADERFLILKDRFSMDHAEGRASTKRIDAFGTLAKVTGFLSKPKEDEFELVYRERRLQPFWRLVSAADYVYERTRRYPVAVPAAVETVAAYGQTLTAVDGQITFEGLETCREAVRKESLYDALTRQPDATLSKYLGFEGIAVEADRLQAAAGEETIVVPPVAKAPELIRDALSGVITRIEADRVLEERIRVEAVELYYRPIYAFRYRRQGKEAVVEFDGLTGDVTTGGATFETYLGKVLDPAFLIDAGVEAATLVIPGARLAEIIVTKGIALARG